MFATRGWMRFALILNLAGSLLFFFSFQATSSNFRLLTTSDGRNALCVDDRALIVTDASKDSNGDFGFVLGMRRCPDWENAKPAAVVHIEKPYFVTLGFVLLTIGFLLQLLSIPNPKTASQISQEITDFQRAEREKLKLNPSTKLPHSTKGRT